MLKQFKKLSINENLGKEGGDLFSIPMIIITPAVLFIAISVNKQHLKTIWILINY